MCGLFSFSDSNYAGFVLKIESKKIQNLLFAMIMLKNIKFACSSFYMLITGLLNLLFPIFVCYLICCFLCA